MSQEQEHGIEQYGVEDAIHVVNMFDQANTGGVIENLGERGRLLREAIENLRADLNANGKRTILDVRQANEGVRPLRPDQVTEKTVTQIPEVVIEVFNELIAENVRSGYGTIKQKDVEVRLRARGVKIKEAHDKHWLDVEDIFRAAGWVVSYDRPVADEKFDAHYTFKIRR